MIVLVGGEKGGSGKTTVAVNLAVALSVTKTVLVLDADPQGTANAWSDRRAANPDLKSIPCIQKTGNVAVTVREFAKQYNVVVIDAGGRASAELRSALTVCDLALFPLRPSQFDLESIPHLIDLCEQADGFRTIPLRAGVVLTQCPTHHLVREEADAATAVAGVDYFGVAKARVRERKAYRDAALSGSGVTELGDEKASHEILMLAKEVLS